MHVCETSEQAALERAATIRARIAERERLNEDDRLQALRIEEKAAARAEQSDEQRLERLNSWDSFLRRTANESRRVGAWMKSNGTYEHAMTLLRYIVRRHRAGSHRIPLSKMMAHVRLGERSVRDLLALLQGRTVRKGDRTLEPFLNPDGSPLITAIDGGQRSNTYVVNKPIITSIVAD